MLVGRKAIGTVAYLGGLPSVLEAFTWSWGQMVAYNAEFLADSKKYVHYARSTFSDHGPARNSLVTAFLGDWLVQLDTDHMFDPDIVGRLLRLANKYEIDVLSGLYQLKNPPHLPVLYQWVSGDKGKTFGLQPIAQWKAQPDFEGRAELMRIGSAGGGCLFVRRSVFDRISRKYNCGPFDKVGVFSEDHSFFHRLRELEIPAYAAMNVHCNHLRVAPVTLNDLDHYGFVGEPFAA